MTGSTADEVRSDASTPLLTTISHYLPIIETAKHYKREDLSSDLIAGVIVAIMLIPQGMAYALLAGLPPQVGLYASLLPLLIYGLFGTSRYLAVGPVAIVSLLTASSIGTIAASGDASYLQLALTLAFLVGLIQTVMGVLRIGFLVNFLSHPVLVGFSSAAAIVIGFSQVKSLLGLSIPRSEFFYEQVWDVLVHLGETNVATLAIGLFSIGALLYFKRGMGSWLRRAGVPESMAGHMTKSGPLVVVGLTTIVVFVFSLDQVAGVDIVGGVPAGLPGLSRPNFDMASWQMLIATAVAISFVGYMESISVAKSLAGKRRQKVDANQELIALGLSNLGAAFTGGYPVTGGFSRSLVNFSAGAKSTIASIITAVLIGLSILFLTPLFYYLPKTSLAAIIIVAVSGLIDVKTFRRVWQYSKRDAFALIITFLAVLLIGIEQGILVGAFTSLVLFIYRTSNPHVALVGRLRQSQIYRNVHRHPVQTWPEVALIRIDASLYFANTKMLEQTIRRIVAEQHELRYLVLIGTAVNDIDFSALETVESIWQELNEIGIELHLAAIKGPVLDKLEKSGLIHEIGQDKIHLTTHDAMIALNFVELAEEA